MNGQYPEAKWFFKHVENLIIDPSSSTETKYRIQQWRKVRKFRQQLKSARTRVFFGDFRDTESFPDVLRADLFPWLMDSHRPWARHVVRPHPSARVHTVGVPSFLRDRVRRTEEVIGAIERLLEKRKSQRGFQIRIHARQSSFAMNMLDLNAHSDDEYYRTLLEKERVGIERLFERGATLKLLLTWNVDELCSWTENGRVTGMYRLKQLLSFCQRTIKLPDRISRAQLLHTDVHDRNMLLMGFDYFFEGRKLSRAAGFEATQVVQDRMVIRREIQMFDTLFKDIFDRQSPVNKRTAGNKWMLKALIQRLRKDIRKLEDTFSSRSAILKLIQSRVSLLPTGFGAAMLHNEKVLRKFR